MILNQAQASDTWAFYQAKSIKGASPSWEAQRGRRARTRRTRPKTRRATGKREALTARAQTLEAERDAAAKHGQPLGFAIASLQIAIALASVCLITKRKALWAASSLLGASGRRT